MNLYKIWNIQLDYTDGATYGYPDIVWDNKQKKVIKINFTNEQQKLKEVKGIVELVFTFADNTQFIDELIDIEGDIGTYIIPSNVTKKQGIVELDIRILNPQRINSKTEIYFMNEENTENFWK